jgi:hypothetical protein
VWSIKLALALQNCKFAGRLKGNEDQERDENEQKMKLNHTRTFPGLDATLVSISCCEKRHVLVTHANSKVTFT